MAAGPIDVETISIAPPEGEGVDLTQLAAEAAPPGQTAPPEETLPCLNVPNIGSPTSDTGKARRSTEGTFKLRRGLTTTPFGTISATVPIYLPAQDATAQTVTQTFNALPPDTGSWYTFQILEQQSLDQHVLRAWPTLAGTVTDMTIAQYRTMFWTWTDTSALRNILYSRAQQLYDVAEHVVKLENILHLATSGGWKVMVSAFGSIPGYAFTIKRYARQPAILADNYASVRRDRKALGTAACALAARLAAIVMLQLNPQTNPRAISMSSRDARYLSISLKVLRDLLNAGLTTLATTGKGGPPVSSDDLVTAVAYIGSGQGGGLGLVPLGHPFPFLNSQAYDFQLTQLNFCQPSGQRASGATA